MAADCGTPLARSDVSLIFNSTLEGSQLIFWCDEYPNEIINASCLSDGRWSVDLNQYSCSTHPQGICITAPKTQYAFQKLPLLCNVDFSLRSIIDCDLTSTYDCYGSHFDTSRNNNYHYCGDEEERFVKSNLQLT